MENRRRAEPAADVPPVAQSAQGAPLSGADLGDGVAPPPLLDGGDVLARGGASWYGARFHQRRTANGERFDMAAMTAAHRTLPFGTLVCVRSLVNRREVLVRVNDRGPHSPNRIIDVSRAAAQELGMLGLGIKQVALWLPDRVGRACGATAEAAPASVNDVPAIP